MDRCLDRLGADDPDASRERVRALRLAALLTFAADFTLWGVNASSEPIPLRIALPATLVACLLLGVFSERGRAACACAALALAGYAVWTLPATGNHPALYALVATLLASFDAQDADERLALLSGLRWLTLIVLFWTGLQKVLAGTYFGAEFLTWSVAHLPRFQVVFAPLIPAEEFARLAETVASADVAATYRVDAPLFVAASNAAWLGEVGFALALIPRATRTLAALAAIGLLLAIEAAAHEVFFGGFFASLLLLFVPARVASRTLPWLALLYAAALALALLLGDAVVIT